MSRPRARRDFVLDTGAIIHFAARFSVFAQWLDEIERRYAEPMVLVPAPVLTECITGDPRSDVAINRLLARITSPDASERHLLTPSNLTFARAGVLRTLAAGARSDGPKHVISPIDALVVALAEERSERTPVVVTTSDAADIRLLVDLTGARNIGVQVV